MTAILIAKQPKHGLVHVVTDAAMYHSDQTVVAFGNKVTAVPHWPGVVTCAGNAAGAPLFGWALAHEFSSWDDMVSSAESGLPKLADTVKAYGLNHATVILAGVSETRGPESFTFQTTGTLPPGVTQAEAEANPYYQPPFRLVKLPDVIMTPVPPPEMSIAAGYEGIDVDAETESVIWSLKKVVAMQRNMPLPDGVGGIGGFAEIVTIAADGITQRILQRWPQDQLGAPLPREPNNWDEWHRANPKPTTKPQLRAVR